MGSFSFIERSPTGNEGKQVVCVRSISEQRALTVWSTTGGLVESTHCAAR